MKNQKDALPFDLNSTIRSLDDLAENAVV